MLQYKAVLEEVGLALEPDLVLVGLFPVNDFDMDTYDTNVRVAVGQVVPGEPWHQSLYVYRAYLHKAQYAARKLLARAAPAAPHDGWQRNTAALREIAAGRVPVLVALLPHTKGFETQRAMFARVEAWCVAEGVRCLNLLNLFRARRVVDGELVLNRIDAHGNAEYHRLLAELLAPRLAALTHPPQP